jgi:hypothetical protein
MKKALRNLAVTAAFAAILMLAACASDSRNDGSGDAGGSNVTLPKVSLPDVSLPNITLPDVSLPDVTLPTVTAPTTSGSGDSGSGDSGSGDAASRDDGLDLVSILAILVLLAGAIALIAAAVQRGRDRNRSAAPTGDNTARNKLTQDLLWVQNQANSVIADGADPSQLQSAWPVARQHFQQIESEAAQAAVDGGDSDRSSEANQAGQSVAALRGAIDSYLSSTGSAATTGTPSAIDPRAAVRQAMAQVEAARQVLLAPH